MAELTTEHAATPQEFTAASSERSDEEGDELQFGNVDMIANSDTAQSADSRAAVQVDILT